MLDDSKSCREISSRFEGHSSTSANNRARDQILAAGRLALSEVNDPALCSSETLCIINIKQKQD